jgi:hypothetical protein
MTIEQFEELRELYDSIHIIQRRLSTLYPKVSKILSKVEAHEIDLMTQLTEKIKSAIQDKLKEYWETHEIIRVDEGSSKDGIN